MAALIPAIGTCVSNMTGGERRLAYRLEQKLEDDWLLWFDVPLGPRNVHPDFVVFTPRHGLLVLKVKDWKLDIIRSAGKKFVPGPFCSLKLEDDWLLWYDVPLGPRNVHPDFVVFNPRRGLLVLEVKDWKLDTIQEIDRQSVHRKILCLAPFTRSFTRYDACDE